MFKFRVSPGAKINVIWPRVLHRVRFTLRSSIGIKVRAYVKS